MSTPKEGSVTVAMLRALLKDHPQGLTMKEIAIALGVTVEGYGRFTTTLYAARKRGVLVWVGPSGTRGRKAGAKLGLPPPAPPPVPSPKPAPTAPATLPPGAQATPGAVGALQPLVDYVFEALKKEIGAYIDYLWQKKLDGDKPGRADVYERLRALESKLLPSAPPAPKHDPQPPVDEEKIKLPRVTIVGLFPDLVSQIQQEYSQKFDLHYVNADEHSNGRLKSLCATSEAIVVMADHVPHQTTNTIVAAHGRMVKVRGNISTLRTLLDASNLVKE